VLLLELRLVQTKSRFSKLAPIAVVMLPEALTFEAQGCLAAFERKAGRGFPQSTKVSLQKSQL